MNKTSHIKKSSNKIEKAQKIKKVVDKTQKIVGDVDSLNQIISKTLYIRDNVAVDLQNYSIFSISDTKNIK